MPKVERTKPSVVIAARDTRSAAADCPTLVRDVVRPTPTVLNAPTPTRSAAPDDTTLVRNGDTPKPTVPNAATSTRSTAPEDATLVRDLQRPKPKVSNTPNGTRPLSVPEGPSAGAGWRPPPAARSVGDRAEACAAGLRSIAGLPVELWLVILAFAGPGCWLIVDVLTSLPDAINAWGMRFLGFRIGLALTMILLLVGLIGAAMLGIAWKLYRRDRVGRGLAYAFCGTIIVSVLFSDSRTTAETWAMVVSIAGVAILAGAPRVRAAFGDSSPATPTSVIVSRTLITIICALGLFVAVLYLLLASVDGAYVAAALIAAAPTVLAWRWSTRLEHGDREARLYLTVGGAVVAVLLIAVGRANVGLLFDLGLIISALGALWLPNDARAFFGDDPLTILL
jgi:hypothetical protein